MTTPANNPKHPESEKKNTEAPVTVKADGTPVVPVSDATGKGQVPATPPAPVVKSANSGTDITHKVNQAHPNQGEMSNAEVVRVATEDAMGHSPTRTGAEETLLQKYQRERAERLKALGREDLNPDAPKPKISNKPDPAANLPKHLWKCWLPNSPEQLVEAPDKYSAKEAYYKKVGIINSIHEPVIVDAFADLDHLEEQIKANEEATKQRAENDKPGANKAK